MCRQNGFCANLFILTFSSFSSLYESVVYARVQSNILAQLLCLSTPDNNVGSCLPKGRKESPFFLTSLSRTRVLSFRVLVYILCIYSFPPGSFLLLLLLSFSYCSLFVCCLERSTKRRTTYIARPSPSSTRSFPLGCLCPPLHCRSTTRNI